MTKAPPRPGPATGVIRSGITAGHATGRRQRRLPGGYAPQPSSSTSSRPLGEDARSATAVLRKAHRSKGLDNETHCGVMEHVILSETDDLPDGRTPATLSVTDGGERSGGAGRSADGRRAGTRVDVPASLAVFGAAATRGTATVVRVVRALSSSVSAGASRSWPSSFRWPISCWSPGSSLVLILDFPVHPSSLRVKAWRRLRGIGAVPLKNSVYLLPFTPENQEHFQRLAQEVQKDGGEATLRGRR